jgi:hypothetical protein
MFSDRFIWLHLFKLSNCLMIEIITRLGTLAKCIIQSAACLGSHRRVTLWIGHKAGDVGAYVLCYYLLVRVLHAYTSASMTYGEEAYRLLGK